jgi:Flp pilus assembly protein TadG
MRRKLRFHPQERGSATLEMAVVVPLAALLLSAVLLLGPYVHIGIAVRQAAYDCAAAAAQSLDAGQGYTQGLAAAQASFGAFRLSAANVSFALEGRWERGGMVSCTSDYTVPVGAFPMRRVIDLPETVSATVALPVQAFKSEWR